MEFEDTATFCKYFSDDEKVIEGIFKENKIRFTQPAALNDPLEFNPILKFDDEIDYYRYKINDILMMSKKDFYYAHLILYRINQYGVLSLTKTPDSFEMWSRYSNGHKGFLIEFKHDFNKFPGMLSKDGSEYPIKKVNYVDDYSISVDCFINQDGTVHNGIDEKLFFNKTSRWEYEKEYRIVRLLSDSSDYKQVLCNPRDRDTKGLYCFDLCLNSIESITFGACMTLENKKKIIGLCHGQVSNFFQALIIRDEKDKYGFQCNVKIWPINNFPDFMSMSDFITDTSAAQHLKKYIEIQNINELPYYNINPQWTTQYYENIKNRLGNKSSD
jgi:hypothetical protein